MPSKYARMNDNNVVESTVSYVPLEDISVPEYMYKCYQEVDPDQPFLVDAFKLNQLTYGQFMSKVQSLVLALVDLDVKPTDMIFFLDDNSFAYTTSYFAALFAGIQLWQLSPSNQAFEVAQRLSNVPDRSVVLMFGTSRRRIIKQMHEEYGSLVNNILKYEIEMDSFEEQFDDGRYGEPIGDLRVTRLIEKFANTPLERIPYYPFKNLKEDTSVIVCTSGTTGPPKGARHTQYSMVNFLNNISAQLKHGRGIRTLLFFATGHISGSMFIPMEFCLGSTVYLAVTVTTQKMMELIEEEGITQTLVTPNNVYEIVNGNFEEKYDLSSFKIAYTGGTILSPSFGEKWATKLPNTPLMNFYGMTEFLCPLVPRNPEHANALHHAATVGPATEMKIICTETGASLGFNQSGEICIRGPGRFKEYYHNPEATNSAIDSEGFYHSGDVGFIDKDLCLHVHDRIKEMIKVYNNSVFPTELEQFIQLKYPQVNAVCVVGIPHPSGDAHLRAYITLKQGSELREEQVVDSIASNFLYYKHIKGVVFIDEMPRTIIGKVDRQYFKRLIQSSS